MNKVLFDKENESRPYLAANAVIIKNINGKKHILLGIRKNVAGAGFYYVPGGHVKMGERINDSLVREVKEECGLDVIVENFVWVEENFEGPHHVTLYYQTRLINSNQEPKNMEPHKCEGWQWFPVSNPPKPLWVTLGDFLKTFAS